MQNFTPGEDAFSSLLEGRLAEASPQLERLAKLARALEPAARAEPNAQFRARLRNELDGLYTELATVADQLTDSVEATSAPSTVLAAEPASGML